MTLPYWDFNNYLIYFEDIQFSGNIVDAPFPMKVYWVSQYLHEIVFPDAIKAITGGSGLSGMLLAFSIIEYLAGYFAGKGSEIKDCKKFLQRYFPEQYKPYLDDIYTHLRNGLVHNLSLVNPWIPSKNLFILENRSELHLQQTEDKVIFSMYHFIEDIRRARVMYTYELIMKPQENEDLVKNFHTRFNKQNGSASVIRKIK